MLGKKSLTDEQKGFVREYVAEAVEDDERKRRRKEMSDEFGVSVMTIAAITAWTTIRANQAVKAGVQTEGKLDAGVDLAVALKEELGRDLYEDHSENDESPVLTGGEHFNFNNEVKNLWRLRMREFIIGNTTQHERSRMKALLLPGKDCIEAEMYLDMGFEPGNITGVEGGDKEARRVFRKNAERLGIRPVLGRLENVLADDPTSYGVVSLDFLGQLCVGYIKILRNLRLDKRALLLTNMMGRRETREIQRRLEGLAFVSNPANSENMLANAVKFGALRMVKDASAGLMNAVWPKLSKLRDEKAWVELCMNAGLDRLDNKPYPELLGALPTDSRHGYTLGVSRVTAVTNAAPKALEPIHLLLKEAYPQWQNLDQLPMSMLRMLAVGLGGTQLVKQHRGYKYFSRAGKVSIPYLSDFMEVERPEGVATDVRQTVKFLLENIVDYTTRDPKSEDKFELSVRNKHRVPYTTPQDGAPRRNDLLVAELHSGKTVDLKMGKFIDDLSTPLGTREKRLLIDILQGTIKDEREIIETNAA